MEEFALIKSRVNLNRVNLGIALISDLKVFAIDLHCWTAKEDFRTRFHRDTLFT